MLKLNQLRFDKYGEQEKKIRKLHWNSFKCIMNRPKQEIIPFKFV